MARSSLQGGGPWGEVLSSAEVYDPLTEHWIFTSSMNMGKVRHVPILLDDGSVLVMGGLDQSGNASSSAEIYNPVLGAWVPTGSMNVTRTAHTATLLPNGKVLVTGGDDAGGGHIRNSAELYDNVAVVGGAVTGFQPRRVQCTNRTTGQTIVIAHMADGVTSWDCAAAGLVVNPGDRIHLEVNGRGE